MSLTKHTRPCRHKVTVRLQRPCANQSWGHLWVITVRLEVDIRLSMFVPKPQVCSGFRTVESDSISVWLLYYKGHLHSHKPLTWLVYNNQNTKIATSIKQKTHQYLQFTTVCYTISVQFTNPQVQTPPWSHLLSQMFTRVFLLKPPP